MRIPYSVAQLLASIAQHHAAAVNVPMAVAIADAGGMLIYFGRMDGALPASTELAESKAFTAAVLRMPTHEVGKLAQPGQTLYGIEQTHQGRIVLFGGGLPLRLNGEVAGAVGISGGTVEQDLEVARPVVGALEEMESWSRAISSSVSDFPVEIPPVDLLVSRLIIELERMGYSMPSRTSRVMTGAILLWLFRTKQNRQNPESRDAVLYKAALEQE